ncbi:MAG: ABC transporter ATP-binding protein [Gammaproteobacteria bacterium]|nr:ABC transporter ATP-binding protein [Gammaproteobacteria bacterium]
MQSESQSSPFIDIHNLSKNYGSKTVLSDIDLQLNAGEIVGLIGPNGAGKSTLLKCIMGLIKFSGQVEIFGKDPFRHRTQLLENMSYVADVASLPEWMQVADLLSFMTQAHPKFSNSRALELLKGTPIGLQQPISTLSKGMKTRLHLAIIMAISTDLLVLDEPTLGLDVLVRREFQDRLISDYYSQQRSILITTHQIDEIESILTRVLFIREGRITMDFKKEELQTRYAKLLSKNNVVFSDPAMQPIYQRALPDQTEFIFENPNREELAKYGEVQAPSLEDLFVATNS